MQLLEYPNVAEKRWEWHHVLFKEWLRLVQPGISERKYLKWLRGRKVFERRFIAFGELVLGVQRGPQVTPNDVGVELLEALDASEARSREAMEAQQAAALARPSGRPDARPGAPAPAPPGRRGPPGQQPAGANGRAAAPPPKGGKPAADDDLPDDGPGGGGGGDDAAAALGPPSAENDPFVKALLERLVELNQYLAMFAYREIGDAFLAPAELMRRINTSAYEGARPTVVQLDLWIQWFEWLGGLKKVGFRHKATTVGRELGAYLVEMPARELFGDDPNVTTLTVGRTDEDAEPEAAPAAPSAPALVARQPGQRPPPADDDDGPAGDDEALGADEVEDEGLDLPPEGQAASDADAYWKRPASSAPHEGDAGPALDEPPPPADAGDDLGPVIPAPGFSFGAPEPEPEPAPPPPKAKPAMPPPSKERVSFDIPPPPPREAAPAAKRVDLPPPSKERVSFELPPPPPREAAPAAKKVDAPPPPRETAPAAKKVDLPPPTKERVSFDFPPPPPREAAPAAPAAKKVDLPPPSKERVSFDFPPPPPREAASAPASPEPARPRAGVVKGPSSPPATAAPATRTPPPTSRVLPTPAPATAAPRPAPATPAPAPTPLPTPSTGGPRPAPLTSDAWPRPSGGWGRPLPPVEDPLRLAVGWWLEDRAPRAGLAAAAGIALAPHPSGKPVAVHKVLALAALVEVGPLDAAVDLVHALEGALEAHLVDGAPLDAVLEAAAARGASPAFEQRLAVLARFRRGLLALPPRALEGARDARALARTLRDGVTGDVLGPGLVLAVRELVTGGLFRLPGLEAIDWLPWPAQAAPAAEGP